MKRIIPLLLILLLCGCAAKQPAQTVSPTETMEATEPAGSYQPGSEAEQLAGGALRQYAPRIPDSYAIASAGEDILLFSGVEKTVITLLKGNNLYAAASAELGVWLHPEYPSFRISDHGITYYDPEARCVVFLDKQLKQVSTLAVPENMTGEPILSSDRLKLYYCTTDAIRVMDLETGIDRLIREIQYPVQDLADLLMQDTVLHCKVAEDDKIESLYIRTETGELIGQHGVDTVVTGKGEIYYAHVPEGTMQVHLFGKAGEEPFALIPENPFHAVTWLDDLHGALTVDQSQDILTLDYYDLRTGRRSASLQLVGIPTPWSIVDEPARGCISFLSEDGGDAVLYRWDITKSSGEEDVVYTSARYTLDNMDEAGLEDCRVRAKELSEAYGVELLVGMDAVRVEPWDYELYPEYQVPVIQRALSQMERILQQYPTDFFRILSDGTTDGPVKICLVRSSTGSPESGSLTETHGIQFWDESTAYVVVAVGNMMEQTFFHEMFHVIETRVLSNSNAYYEWDKLNPEDFEYDYSYLTNLERSGEEYLTGGDRAFIDTYSMSFPKEDRARIMEYAATVGNETYFLSDTMQRKLQVLCQGIRQAFDLEESSESFIWEQYLNRPITE